MHLQWRRENVSAISNASPANTLVEWIPRRVDDITDAPPLPMPMADEDGAPWALLVTLEEFWDNTRWSDRRRVGDRIAMAYRFVLWLDVVIW